MKREREKHITRLHIILFFFVLIVGLIVFFVVKGKINNSSVMYNEYEKEIVQASKNYYKINDLDLDEGYEKKVDITTLYEDGLLYNEKKKKKCKGYSIIYNEGSFSSDDPEISYTAYIKCGNKYKTGGYDQY